MGNRIQHALRAYTAKDQRALRLAAETYRENPRFSVEQAILEVGVGEAVTSFLEKKGVPGIVERTLIRPPSSQLGPITAAERKAVISASEFSRKYDTAVDSHSAYEILQDRMKRVAEEGQQNEIEEAHAPLHKREFNTARRYSGMRVGRGQSRRYGQQESVGSALSQALVKELKGTTGRRIIRGVLGSFFKGG